MARGDKKTHTKAQKDQAQAIEASYEERGTPKREAEARAWATVNKQSGGGEKSGSGRNTSSAQKTAARKDSASRAVATKHGHSPNRGNASESSKATGSLATLRKDELLERAAKKGIVGRSRMRKAELIEALRAA